MKSIGRRNQLVTIQAIARTPDGQGGNAVTYSTRGQEWALVEPMTGAEAQMAAQMTATLTTGVTIPFRTDVSVQDRIVLGSRTLQVESVQDPTARREELRLLCAEVQA